MLCIYGSGLLSRARAASRVSLGAGCARAGVRLLLERVRVKLRLRLLMMAVALSCAGLDGFVEISRRVVGGRGERSTDFAYQNYVKFKTAGLTTGNEFGRKSVLLKSMLSSRIKRMSFEEIRHLRL